MLLCKTHVLVLSMGGVNIWGLLLETLSGKNITSNSDFFLQDYIICSKYFDKLASYEYKNRFFLLLYQCRIFNSLCSKRLSPKCGTETGFSLVIPVFPMSINPKVRNYSSNLQLIAFLSKFQKKILHKFWFANSSHMRHI